MRTTELERKVLEYSFARNWGHIPSALTQVEYVSRLLHLNYKRVAGKPFGAQAWYVALGVECNSPILQAPYVDWNCQTIGHSLGYSIGLSRWCDTWLNISDAALELGDFWEALQLWPKFVKQHLLVTVDCNGYGCKHTTPGLEILERRISAFGIDCCISKPHDIQAFSSYTGIVLVDTSETLGAELKHLGFHYTKFKDFEDFNEKYCRSLATRP